MVADAASAAENAPRSPLLMVAELVNPLVSSSLGGGGERRVA